MILLLLFFCCVLFFSHTKMIYPSKMFSDKDFSGTTDFIDKLTDRKWAEREMGKTFSKVFKVAPYSLYMEPDLLLHYITHHHPRPFLLFYARPT